MRHHAVAISEEYPDGKKPFTEKEEAEWDIKEAEELAQVVSNKKISLKTKINEIRYSKIYMDSIPYTFPGDIEPDGVQMRDETDRQNIQDFVTDATTNDPTTEMIWMPVSNTPKTMTSAQAIEMGKYLKARGDAIMGYSWNLKGQISAAENLEALNQIDITTGWPE